MTKKELAVVVAKTYNDMDLSIIEPYLSDDFVYEMPHESFSWVRRMRKHDGIVTEQPDSRYSKARYLHFQEMIFDIVKRTSAEVTFSKSLNQIAVKLFWGSQYEGTLKICKKGDQIVRIRQCYLPEENGLTETEE